MSHRKTRNWKPAFLEALAQTGLVSLAARQANISPRTAQHARDLKNRQGANLAQAQAFADAWDLALEQFSDSVELEIRRRALHGDEREIPIFYKGEQVGARIVHVYSDRLLMFLARALRPQHYGPHRNTPDQFRLAIPTPQPNLLDEARERARQRWNSLVPRILNVFTQRANPPSSTEPVIPSNTDSNS